MTAKVSCIFENKKAFCHNEDPNFKVGAMTCESFGKLGEVILKGSYNDTCLNVVLCYNFRSLQLLN